MDYKISIAICTYNGSKYIEDQLLSIINQTRKPDEIIICDDNSSDDSVDIVRSILNNSEIKWHLHVNEDNLGVVKNFEKAISLCKGDIIFTSDQDDYWLENKIEKIELTFKESPEASLVFTDAILVDDNLKSLGNNLWQTVGFNENHTKMLDILLNHNIVTGATMAFRKTLVSKILPISKYWIHDYWIAFIATANGNIVCLPEKLVLYRQHENNVIGAKKIKVIPKIKIYISNIKKLDEIRGLNEKMYSDLIKHINSIGSFSKEDFIKIKKCYEFWIRKTHLSSNKKHEAVISISKDMFNGDYLKYYTGFRGALRDFVSLVNNNND